MSWAKKARASLQKGEKVQIVPKGEFSQDVVPEGSLVTLHPLKDCVS